MAVVGTEQHHENLVEELLASVETYNPDVDRDLIRRAFTTAEERHRGQLRRSGEDFIHHPYGVARICSELHLDEQTIAAALLHDVVEDTDAELDDLRAEFGAEIAQLVEGVTKLTRIQFSSREQAEAENYRKMIVAMAQDVRVILIKLADRLHNMPEAGPRTRPLVSTNETPAHETPGCSARMRTVSRSASSASAAASSAASIASSGPLIPRDPPPRTRGSAPGTTPAAGSAAASRRPRAPASALP